MMWDVSQTGDEMRSQDFKTVQQEKKFSAKSVLRGPKLDPLCLQTKIPK
jgi:hypothetical protein